MKPVMFDHPVGHRRLYSPNVQPPGHKWRDPANYWKCACGVISRSWEAADKHTADEHGGT